MRGPQRFQKREVSLVREIKNKITHVFQIQIFWIIEDDWRERCLWSGKIPLTFSYRKNLGKHTSFSLSSQTFFHVDQIWIESAQLIPSDYANNIALVVFTIMKSTFKKTRSWNSINYIKINQVTLLKHLDDLWRFKLFNLITKTGTRHIIVCR